MKYIIGNWKTYISNNAQAKKLIDSFYKNNSKKYKVVITPVATMLTDLYPLLKRKNYFLGAQDFNQDDSKILTGSIFIDAIVNTGAKYCIVGHHETRSIGVTDIQVAEKAKKLIDYKMTPIICVSVTGANGQAFKKLEKTLKLSTNKVDISKCIIAYEPAHHIGAKDAQDNESIELVVSYIKKYLTSISGTKNIKVLYGGSVNSKNFNKINMITNLNGVLIGRASVEKKEFNKIIKSI